jgi:hypothetical protein
MTGRTDFGVDLKAPLKLHLVILTKRTFEGEIEVFHMASGSCGHCATSPEREAQNGGKGEVLDHCLSLSHSAGVAAAEPSAALP